MQKGILLVNLGTPEEPTPEAVKSFLAEFLSIVSNQMAAWVVVINLYMQLCFRSVLKTARTYQKIWRKKSSPLWIYTKRQTKLLQALCRMLLFVMR